MTQQKHSSIMESFDSLISTQYKWTALNRSNKARRNLIDTSERRDRGREVCVTVRQTSTLVGADETLSLGADKSVSSAKLSKPEHVRHYRARLHLPKTKRIHRLACSCPTPVGALLQFWEVPRHEVAANACIGLDGYPTSQSWIATGPETNVCTWSMGSASASANDERAGAD